MKSPFQRKKLQLNYFQKNVRLKFLKWHMEAGSNSSHFGGALSIVEIISTLFSYQMKIDKNNPEWDDREIYT